MADTNVSNASNASGNPKRARRPRTDFNAARRRQFITHLTRLGVVRHAARETGIDPKTAYTRARTDRNFAVQWAAALGKDMDMAPVLTGNHPRGPAPKKTRQRHNAFRGKRQQTFLMALADTSNAQHAAAIAGINLSTAYKHRDTDAGFRAAWQDAVHHGFADLAMEMLARARFGTPKPIIHAGKQTGEVKVLNDMMGLKLLDRFDRECSRMDAREARMDDAGSRAAMEKRISDLRRRLLQTRPDLVVDDGYEAMIAARKAQDGDGAE